MAEVLAVHMTALDSRDAAAQQEYAAYQQLVASAFRTFIATERELLRLQQARVEKDQQMLVAMR